MCFKTVLLLLLLFGYSSALFEDQVGKFDWRIQQLGCPNEVLFERSDDGSTNLFLSTTRNLIGAININSGEIDWRQLNEQSNHSSSPNIFLKDHDLFSIVNGGEYLRVFDSVTGTLRRQHRLNLHDLRKSDIVAKDALVIIRAGHNLIAFTERKNPRWQVKLPSDIDWLGIAEGKSHVIAVGKSSTAGLRIRFFNYEDGKEAKLQVDDIANDKFSITKDCVLSGNSLVCLDGRTLNTAYFTDDTHTRLSFVEIEGADQLFGLHVLNRPHLFSFRAGSKLSLLRVDEKVSEVVLSTAYGNLQTCDSGPRPIFAVYTESSEQLRIVDQTTKKQVAEISIPAEGHAPVKSISILESGQLFEILVVREDCRIDFYEAQRREKTTASLEWSRFEGLASISTVEMIDLPLSDSQATIETEFGSADASIWKSFFLRISGQIEQARRSFIALGNQFARALQLLTSGEESITNVVRVLWGEKTRPHKKPRSGAPLAESKVELLMERDYFNLNKMIVVSTLSGSLYGIHNQYGTVLWSLYLGTQFEPLKTQMGASKVPLFIQRTTSHYQHNSQAAVAFRLKGTQKTRILLFNPINGEVVDSHTYDSVNRVELAPFVNKEMLSPLMIVGASGGVRFLPAVEQDFKPPQPIHLFSIDIKSGTLKGQLLSSALNSLETAWTTQLNLRPDEKIVAVAGRNRNERVHSQGKVLGDRSVLYKYSNPNLVTVLTVDPTHTVLTIYLVDSVSGSIIHMAKHERASEPVNLLHCENWVVFSYWNEKSRRTEVGVIELFEGMQQTNAKHFNSFTTLRQPLNVVSNSFVFPQGISAIAASDTEQGLTTRSVIIAMPFGGVLEVSKRLLDARRPLEMTPELREEMIIPYMPEIPIATEDLINYNQTVLQIDGIKTAPSGLESTSLLLAHGLDLFYTRMTPSGTFDILKDDFDYVLISLVLLGLVVASFVLKRISRIASLKQAWG